MKYSVKKLIAQVEEGKAVDFYFFWGHTPKQVGGTDKSCLSQWYPAPFVVQGITYPTAEHWMMAQKALLFKDENAFQQILDTPKPGSAKAIGRRVIGFDELIWIDRRYDIVLEGSYHKFSQHEALRRFLLQTGKKVIVEASPVDNIWGIGLSQDSSSALNPINWKGTNLLGFALMETRDKLL